MFGIDFLEAGLALQLTLALLGGALSFLSPCVLPIVPPYLAYMSGSSLGEMEQEGTDWRVVGIAGAFVLGLATVFVGLGFAASALGNLIAEGQFWLGRAAGIVLVIFGLHFLGILRIPFLYREARFEAKTEGGSAIGAYILGLAFAFGWTPCIGPILSAILGIGATQEGARAVWLMALYALGLGLPFLLAAIFLRRFLGWMGRFRRHMGTVERAMGGLLIVVGVMMLTGMFTSMSYWLLETFPALARIG